MRLQTTLLFAVLSYAHTSHANVEIFQPEFPNIHPSTPIDTTITVEKITPATLQNNTTIETHVIAIPNPFDDDGLYRDYADCDHKPSSAPKCHFNFALNTQDAGKFKVLLLPGIGPVLVPITWQVLSAAMGPSGIAAATLASPAKDEVIQVHNTAACTGCSMRAATLYFPETLKNSVANDFGGISDPKHLINLVRVNSQKVLFSYQIPGYSNKTHGVALYAHGPQTDDNFQSITLSVQPQHQSQIRNMLNFYIATHQDN